MATLTYAYADSTAVLGPLATYAEPHCYDLCEMHSARLTAPQGWEVVRLEFDPASLEPSNDDLQALANAVREVGQQRGPAGRSPSGRGTDSSGQSQRSSGGQLGRRGHLRAVPPIGTESSPHS